MTTQNLKRVARIAVAVLVALAAAGLAVRSWRNNQQQQGQVGAFGVGAPAPDFTLPDLAGKPVRLSSLRGKPVLVNFWASWCGPCKQEMPAIEAWYKANQGQVAVLGLDMAKTAPDEPQKARDFAQKLGITYPILFADDNVPSAYQVQGLPTSVWVDAHGVIRSFMLGGVDEQKLRSAQRQFE